MDIDRLRVIEARAGSKKQKAALVELINAYMKDAMGEERVLGRAVEKRLVSKLFKYPTAKIFFAEYDSRFIGLAVCFIGFSTFHARKLMNIHDLIVLPECRKFGVARRIMSAIEDKAKAMGCCKLTLEVREDNIKAKRLYKKLGLGSGHHPMLFWTKML